MDRGLRFGAADRPSWRRYIRYLDSTDSYGDHKV